MENDEQSPAQVPAEYIVPCRILVDATTWERLVEELEHPAEPTPALRALMHRDTD